MTTQMPPWAFGAANQQGRFLQLVNVVLPMRREVQLENSTACLCLGFFHFECTRQALPNVTQSAAQGPKSSPEHLRSCTPLLKCMLGPLFFAFLVPFFVDGKNHNLETFGCAFSKILFALILYLTPIQKSGQFSSLFPMENAATTEVTNC